MQGVRARLGTPEGVVSRPVLTVLPGGHAGEVLVLGGREWTGMGTSLALELLERGEAQGRDRDSSLIAAAGVLAMRCARALLAGDPHAEGYAALALALHEEAVRAGVEAAWDEACTESDDPL